MTTGEFSALPPERQEAIMAATIEGFGRHGYKDAHTDDIARQSGISKGLLFFYFRNKRSLYKRAMEFLYERALAFVVDDTFYQITDFYDLLLYAGEQKLALLDKWPWATEFCIRAYYPDHRDIRDDMNSWNRAQFDWMYDKLFTHVDKSKFRDGVDPKDMLDMLVMLGDGYLHTHIASKERLDMSALLEQYRSWCAMLKTWSYKPEYL